MKVEQILYTSENGWDATSENHRANAQLVFVFISSEISKNKEHYQYLKERYKKADIIMATTAGEICDTIIYESSVSVVAIEFEKTKVKVIKHEIKAAKESFDIGAKMSKELSGDNLQHIFILSEGLEIYGSQLIQGVESVNKNNVGISGGLAGDGADFKSTGISLNSEIDTKKYIVMVGLYGKNIQIGKGSIGGWDTFGQKRIVTKSKNNTVYELDGEPILDLYKKYLGNLAKELPGSGLLFPLNITTSQSKNSTVRTLLAIDETEKSITFAGEIPEGSVVELMKANFDRLIDGAAQAAEVGIRKMKDPKLAILISCVGRKLVLKQRTEEELESIRELLGSQTIMTGFYSYGEIGPSEHDILDCKLHNQTMTITLIDEI